MANVEYELYQVRPAVGDDGMFYYTECGNRIYHTGNDPMLYHNKICPKCMYEKPDHEVVLIFAGSPYADKIRKERGNKPWETH